MINDYDNNDYRDIGILDIIISDLDISDLDYQAQGYNHKVLINYCNSKKNKCGYRLTYFETREKMKNYIQDEICDLEWATINGF